MASSLAAKLKRLRRLRRELLWGAHRGQTHWYFDGPGLATIVETRIPKNTYHDGIIRLAIRSMEYKLAFPKSITARSPSGGT